MTVAGTRPGPPEAEPPNGAPPEWWREVVGDEDAAALRRYQRPRASDPRLDRAALIVIDVVESFVGPDAPVAVAQRYARTACGQNAWRALPAIAALLENFRRAGRPVVYTVVDRLQSGVGAATVGSVDVSGPRGDVVHPSAAPRTDEVVLPKTRSSAFFATPLCSLLVRQDVRTVVLAGCTTTGCVLATAIDASSLGFEVVVVPEACFDRVDLPARAALVSMDAKWARVRPVEMVLAAVDAAASSAGRSTR